MSEEVVQIEYLRPPKITIKITETYDEFISQLVSKLFLTDKMKNSLILKYFDEDNDEITIDKETYSTFLSETNKADLKIILTIPEATYDVSQNYDEIRTQVDEKMNSIKSDINEYKKKLKESCQNVIQKKLKEIDDKNQKELKDLKKIYENKLIKIKEESKKQTKDLLNEMQNNSEVIILEKLKEYNKYIEQEIENIIKGKEESFQKKVDEIDFGLLEQKQNDVGEVVENNKKELFDAIND